MSVYIVSPDGIPVTAEDVKREEDRQFLSEVERRAGASREEMLNEISQKFSGQAYADLAERLIRILGEKP